MVDEDGNALGVMSSYEALQIATARGLDLVEISATSKPPVCKIVDYGKFNYERQKKEKLAKKNQHVMHIKEIRFNPNTDTHDIDFKTKHLRQFLILPDKNKIQLHKDNVSKEKKQLAKTAEKKETSNPITEENKTIEKEDA